MGFLSKLFGGTPRPVGLTGPVAERECNIFLLLRQPVSPSPQQVHLAAERAWNHPFAGEPSKWFVYFHELIGDLWTISFGNGSITVSFIKSFVYEDDHADDRMPHIRYRSLWPAHQSRLSIFYGPRVDAVNVVEQMALISRLALQLIDDNCVGVYNTLEKRIILNGPELLADLREKASHAPPNADVA